MSKLILTSLQRAKEDENDDSLFYSVPRFSYHLDEAFRLRLNALYQELIPENSVILDLMSSWVSYLPEEAKYKKVIGHGMNLDELQQNKQLDSYWVQNLNQKQQLPLSTSSVDICLMVAAWQYLQYPEQVSDEIYRILKPKSKLIISFTNRAFWSKAPNIWIQSSDSSRINYIKTILISGGWTIIRCLQEDTYQNRFHSLISLKGDPFLCVIAMKE